MRLSATGRSRRRLEPVPAPADGPRATARLRHRAPLLLALAGILIVSAAWVLATPVFAYPDEGAHVTRAAAVADGQLVPPDQPVSKEGWSIVRAPNSA